MKKLLLLFTVIAITLSASAENYILYTSSDGKVVTPYGIGIYYFGTIILSNTYENGQGKITFDQDVTKIGYQAFSNRSNLNSVVIPNVTIVEGCAFEYCTNLTSVEIPNTVTSLGSWVFYKCSNLKEIIVNSITPPTIYSNTFDGVSKTEAIVKVPSEAVEAYKAAEYWKRFSNIVGIEETTGIEGAQNGSSLKPGKAYNLQGVEVGDGYKGIVIRNGKKVLKK